MRVETLAIGTELLLGQIVNSNAAEIATRLADHGFARRQSGQDRALHMIAPRGRKQEDFGFRRPTIGCTLKHKGANFLGTF